MWTKLVNRGGLFEVTDEAYSLFANIEMVVRKQLQVGKVMEFKAGVKDKVIKDVLKSDSVMWLVWSRRTMDHTAWFFICQWVSRAI